MNDTKDLIWYDLFTYKAGSINVPKLVNEKLTKEYENQEHAFLVFSQTDIIDLAKDSKKMIQTYLKFMEDWNLPFTTYYFYGRFNSVMPETANRPNPKLLIESKKGICCVISQPAYGFLIINVSKLKQFNIKLDETYPEIFYIQDLAEQCFKHNLWISNCNFIEIDKSWEMFKSHKNEGYNIDIKKFIEEKERYNKIPRDYKPVNVFVDAFKKYIDNDCIIKETVNASDVNITINNEPELIDINKISEAK